MGPAQFQEPFYAKFELPVPPLSGKVSSGHRPESESWLADGGLHKRNSNEVRRSKAGSKTMNGASSAGMAEALRSPGYPEVLLPDSTSYGRGTMPTPPVQMKFSNSVEQRMSEGLVRPAKSLTPKVGAYPSTLCSVVGAPWSIAGKSIPDPKTIPYAGVSSGGKSTCASSAKGLEKC